MKHRYLASIAVSLALVTGARAGTRPHYGGTLRVQSRDVVTSIDGIWTAPSTILRQQLSYLLFDRLTRVDDSGFARPSLAMSWKADAQQRIWEFQLRKDATFSGGSSVSAADVVSSISKAAPRWKVSAQGDRVIIETESGTPHLPELLALPDYSIIKRDGGNILGSGPFRIDAFEAARRIVLAANDDYWGGRPYLDKVEITMGGSVREQLINRRLDLDDVVELSLDQARTIGYGASSNVGSFPAQRLVFSKPADLYALVFFRAPVVEPVGPTTNPRLDDARIREALALTIDRNAISGVLLQKQADPAFGLLPQWMTGYSFLFPQVPDVERARKLRSDAFHNAPVSIPVAYDASDNIARAIAERVAVNAREANITLQLFGEKNLTLDSAGNTGAQAVLVRLPVASASASASLSELEMRSGLSPVSIVQAQTVSGPGSLYAAERSALESYRIVPIAYLPQIYWLNPRVRDWAPSNAGSWHLENVWVDVERPVNSPAAILR